ncbi:DUF488 domain-containing protein [Sphingomonas lacunae]|uniref:DUF488 domain-containing protein n=1 Tax=Sphingomonas lacunae TaxID=2698828 RepID=A0A6M4AYL2_9SPHN|nr:DUF488 domain-containing protein [Sphingomonas lacunae]QJQ32111.1 DUF488 domain-containing protein [Sphingomonas lacunae]
MELFTIGYERASVCDFLVTLQRVGIEQVIDIRELPQSRRKGFSKNQLAGHLEGAGIIYRHFRQLGDPKHGREAAKAGLFDEFKAIYNAHLDLNASLSALKDVASLAFEKKSVLLCYERDARYCHRKIVADRLSVLYSFRVNHLGVREGIGEADSSRQGRSEFARASI